MKERTISDLEHEVGDDVLFAIDLLEKRYGAIRSHDSLHKKSPRWIYDFPKYGGAQVAVPLNKKELTVYLRDRTRDGRLISDVLSIEKIKKSYPRDGKPAGSVARATYLSPSADNSLLMVSLDRDDVAFVLDAYLLDSSKKDAPRTVSTFKPIDGVQVGNRVNRRIVSAEELQIQLDRNTETGKAGELAAVLYELERLRNCGCVAPEEYVERVSLSDVGRGYDIASTWPGEERCIEVKSTTCLGSEIYLSENERQVLEALADKAWIYRVLVTPQEATVVGQPIQDPIPLLRSYGMTAVIWRAPDPSEMK